MLFLVLARTRSAGAQFGNCTVTIICLKTGSKSATLSCPLSIYWDMEHPMPAWFFEIRAPLRPATGFATVGLIPQKSVSVGKVSAPTKLPAP